jgi:hypothetical protein
MSREHSRDIRWTQSTDEKGHVSHEQVIQLLATTTYTTLQEILNLSKDHILEESEKLGLITMPGNIEQAFSQ